jgi:hypothetical protein
MLKPGDDCYATADAVEQGILPAQTKLHFVRFNQTKPYLGRVTWKSRRGSPSREVHIDFLTEYVPTIEDLSAKVKRGPRISGLLKKHEYREGQDTLSADCACGEWVSADGSSKWLQWIEHFMGKLNR